MKDKEYIENAVKTEAYDRSAIAARMADNTRLMHGAIGIATESGELLDAVKKSVFYGKPLDAVNVKEELGDLMWYVAIICDQFGFSLEEIKQINIDKLRKRYPQKFTESSALNRDLDAERKVLES